MCECARHDLELPAACKGASPEIAAVDLFPAALTSAAETDIIVQVRLQQCGVRRSNGTAFLMQVLRRLGEDLWCKLGADLSDAESFAAEREQRLAEPDRGSGQDLYVDPDGGDDGSEAEGAEVEAGTQAFELVELLELGRAVIKLEDVTHPEPGEKRVTTSYWLAEASALRRIFFIETLSVDHYLAAHFGPTLESESAELTIIGEGLPKKLRVVDRRNCEPHVDGCCEETEHEQWEFVDGTYVKTRSATPTWEF